VKVYVIVQSVDYEGDELVKVVDSLSKAIEFTTYHDPVVGEYRYYEVEVE
jgi:hypothetical protein